MTTRPNDPKPNGTIAYVQKLPDCDICTHISKTQRAAGRPNPDSPFGPMRTPYPIRKAAYDAKTIDGPWAFLCPTHYREHRFYPDLGTGKGQALEVTPHLRVVSPVPAEEKD